MYRNYYYQFQEQEIVHDLWYYIFNIYDSVKEPDWNQSRDMILIISTFGKLIYNILIYNILKVIMLYLLYYIFAVPI